MERHSFAMELKEGKKNDYRRKLGEIWPELTAFLDQEKVHNFSIWNCDSRHLPLGLRILSPGSPIRGKICA